MATFGNENAGALRARYAVLLLATLASVPAEAQFDDHLHYSPYPGPCVATSYDPDGLRQTVTYTYDEAGRLQSTERLFADGGRGWSSTHEYGADGRFQGTAHDRNGDGESDAFETWEHDSDGRLTRRNYRGSAEEEELVSVYEYDSSGRRLRQLVTTGGGSTSDTTYEYDTVGRLVSSREISRFGSGSVEEEVLLIEYNAVGQRVAVSSQGDDLTSVYTYHRNGAVASRANHRGEEQTYRVEYGYDCFPDSDLDGIPDVADQCPGDAEVFCAPFDPTFDYDGCPGCDIGPESHGIEP